MLRVVGIMFAAVVALGCRGGVIYADAGPSGQADAGMDSGLPPAADGAMPPPSDGSMPPPPPDGAMPPPLPDGSMPPPPPDGSMPPPLDGGTCDRSPSGGMRCCHDNEDCGVGPGGMPLRCYGATCAAGGEGHCVPPAPPGRCFGALDCPVGQTCTGGALGCDACSAVGCAPPTLGTCG